MTERKARMFEISNDYIISALAIGLMVLAGQLYLKKPLSSAVNSLVKSIMGFIVFNVGVALFLSAANDLRSLVNIACGIHAEANTNTYFQTKGIYYVPVMVLGFILHLLLEKYLVKPEKRIANMGGCHVITRYRCCDLRFIQLDPDRCRFNSHLCLVVQHSAKDRRQADNNHPRR